MTPHSDPVFDVALLIGDIKAKVEKLPKKERSHRALSIATGIPTATIGQHLGPQPTPRMSGDHTARWMMWLGHYDIREYVKEDE